MCVCVLYLALLISLIYCLNDKEIPNSRNLQQRFHSFKTFDDVAVQHVNQCTTETPHLINENIVAFIVYPRNISPKILIYFARFGNKVYHRNIKANDIVRKYDYDKSINLLLANLISFVLL